MSVVTEGVRHSLFGRTVSEVVLSTSTMAARLQPVLDHTAVRSHEAAMAVAALLSPTATIALVFGAWRLGMDLGWTGQFVIVSGLFSHWQVWIALAMVLEALKASILRTHRKSDSPEQN